jgi:hypothetical protein
MSPAASYIVAGLTVTMVLSRWRQRLSRARFMGTAGVLVHGHSGERVCLIN